MGPTSSIPAVLLRTFGGLSIETEPGAGPIPPPGPRRLALLALVAAAGARGITRERIIGILWAETEEELARHTLSQTLYTLRRDTGRDWITGSTQLRLDDSISSDIREFHDALNADQLARAVSIHHGPFLDGFYLPGAPEFERWVEETRARLQFALLKALETLARRALEAGSHREAAHWWQRLCANDPFSANYAAGQIRALISAGDQAAALRCAREYESRVRRELDSEPDPIIGQLIAKLRVLPAAPVTPVDPPTVAAPIQPTSAATNARASKVTRSFRRTWLQAAIAVAAVSAVVAWGIRQSNSTASAPFLAIGTIQSRDSASPSGVLRDMLATNLARINGIQVVSNSRLIELLPRAAGTNPAATADAARRAGASEIVEGELAVTSGGLVLTLRRVALRSGVVRQGYTVRAADLYALTDSATAAIAHDFRLDPPPNAVATVRTSSAIAYALYEEGLRALYGADPHAAVRLMSAALERDSSFAMAAFFAWMSSQLAQRYDDVDRFRPLARRLATRATERERLIIQALLAREEAPVAEYLSIARQLTSRFPQDPDGQISLGFALGGSGDWAGSVAAFNRAVAIDSTSGATGGSFCRVCNAIYGMMGAYLWWDSLPAAERTARRLLILRPGEMAAWGTMLEPLLRQGRRADAEAAIARAVKLSMVKLDFASLLDRDLIRSGRSDELEARLVSELRDAPPHERGERPWLLAFALRNQGRLRAAHNLAANGELPGNTARLSSHHDATTLAISALERGQPHEAARRFLDMVGRDRAGPEAIGRKSRILSWHMTLAGTALAAAGDTAALRPLADSVERIGANSSSGRDHNLHFFLRGLLLQHQNRHAEAIDAFQRSLFSKTDGYTRINLVMAKSLLVLQRYPEAIAILQSALRGGVDGSNTYVTHTELHEALAQVFEAAGQRDSAAVHYTQVERLWRRADPEFAERYRIAKSRAAPVR